MPGDDDDHQMLWMDDEEEAEEEVQTRVAAADPSNRASELEAELKRTKEEHKRAKEELAEVRRDLAAKVSLHMLVLEHSIPDQWCMDAQRMGCAWPAHGPNVALYLCMRTLSMH